MLFYQCLSFFFPPKICKLSSSSEQPNKYATYKNMLLSPLKLMFYFDENLYTDILHLHTWGRKIIRWLIWPYRNLGRDCSCQPPPSLPKQNPVVVLLMHEKSCAPEVGYPLGAVSMCRALQSSTPYSASWMWIPFWQGKTGLSLFSWFNYLSVLKEIFQCFQILSINGKNNFYKRVIGKKRVIKTFNHSSV